MWVKADSAGGYFRVAGNAAKLGFTQAHKVGIIHLPRWAQTAYNIREAA